MVVGASPLDAENTRNGNYKERKGKMLGKWIIFVGMENAGNHLHNCCG